MQLPHKIQSVTVKNTNINGPCELIIVFINEKKEQPPTHPPTPSTIRVTVEVEFYCNMVLW